MLWWTLSASLLIVSLLGGVAQWIAVMLAVRRLRADENARGYSMIPFVIGGLGVCGCLISPSRTVQHLWWLPLIVDPGCVGFVVALVQALLAKCFGLGK